MYRPCVHCGNGGYDKDYCPDICTYGEDRKRLKELEDAALTIDPASLRPKGEWIVCGDGDNVPWMCSHCGKTTAHKYKVMYGNFCPNCGADMRGEATPDG